jgi:hypothetical protein
VPFIITTRRAQVREVPAGEGHPQMEAYRHLAGATSTSEISVATSRRAVATPEEARTIVEIGPDGRAREQEVFDEMESWEGDESITVGPLPDGTVIEVEPRGWEFFNWHHVEPPMPDQTPHIIAAYNAAQGS